MLLLAGLLLGLLAFGTLVAPVLSLQFNSTSVRQCAPLLLSFSGSTSSVSGTPASLTILPFNSTVVIVIPLQETNFSAGIELNFLPFTAGSEFIMSLDDASGNSVINNSGIFPILPSPNNNSTCIPGPDRLPPTFFTMPSSVVSQCQTLTIHYNTSVASQAPSVRLYSRSGPSSLLNTTSDDPTSGVATYTMAFPFGHEIILAMDNGNGTTETTPLLLVGGDSSSPTACLWADSSDTASDITRTSLPTSRIIVIAISCIIGAVVVLLGICLILRKRRRCQHQDIHFDKFLSSETDSHNEKHTISRKIVLEDLHSTRFDNNTSNLSLEKGYYDRDSLLTLLQATPEDQHDLAWSKAYQSLGPANHRFDPCVFSSLQQVLLHPQPIARPFDDRHLRAPVDVPADLNPSTDSFYPSVYEMEPSSLTTPAMSHARSINGRIGLPTSPRDGLRANISREPSKRSNASTQHWSASTQHWSAGIR